MADSGLEGVTSSVDASRWARVRETVNWVNLSTPLGLAIAAGGRARLTRRPRGIWLAAGYRWSFPVASAFTVGSVVISTHDEAYLLARPELLRHEERHSSQYALCLGLPFVPLYVAAAGWSWLRTGDFAVGNFFERRAGLADGHYVVPTAEQLTASRSRRLEAIRATLLGAWDRKPADRGPS